MATTATPRSPFASRPRAARIPSIKSLPHIGAPKGAAKRRLPAIPKLP